MHVIWTGERVRIRPFVDAQAFTGLIEELDLQEHYFWAPEWWPKESISKLFDKHGMLDSELHFSFFAIERLDTGELIGTEVVEIPQAAVIRAEIDTAGGRIPFARFMELALYHPVWGYYLSPLRRPGRPGDFLTAPETHPFFGIALARRIAECWERLEHPDPFVVREYGSGIGALAWDVITGLSEEAPECRAVLQYRLVETNPHRLAQFPGGSAVLFQDDRFCLREVRFLDRGPAAHLGIPFFCKNRILPRSGGFEQ